MIFFSESQEAAKNWLIFIKNQQKIVYFFDRMRKMFHFFRQDKKNDSKFLTKYEKKIPFFRQNAKCGFNFFDKMQKLGLFLTKCEKCFSFFDNTWNVFQFFYEMQKVLGFFQDAIIIRSFLLVYKHSSFLFLICVQKLIRLISMCANSEQQIKLCSYCFFNIKPELLIYSQY